MKETATDRANSRTSAVTPDRATPHIQASHAVAVREPAPPPYAHLLRFVVRFLGLLGLWAVLTDFRVDALVFGVPAAVAGASLVLLIPYSPGWRMSPRGAAVFMVWFAVQSVRGAIDVAARAFSPRMPLRPGFRTYAVSLPKGAPRILFLNTITLLPGTLSAEVTGDDVIVHMLDTRADLESDLMALEARIVALFALNSLTEVSR